MFIWQFPQYLVGYIATAFIKEDVRAIAGRNRDIVVIGSRHFLGGVSFGHVIFLHANARYGISRLSIAHETGHCIQSRRLGWLYLPTVGLVSGIRAGLGWYRKGRYYDSWPENWADRLGGITIKDGRRHV